MQEVSAFNHDASEIKSKHEGEDSMFFLGTSAGTQVQPDKCSSSSRSYKNTEYGGNKKIRKYENTKIRNMLIYFLPLPAVPPNVKEV